MIPLREAQGSRSANDGVGVVECYRDEKGRRVCQQHVLMTRHVELRHDLLDNRPSLLRDIRKRLKGVGGMLSYMQMR